MVVEVWSVAAELNIYSELKEIALPETVPMMAVPLWSFPLSLYAITNSSEVKAETETYHVAALLKTYSLPKVMLEVEEV